MERIRLEKELEDMERDQERLMAHTDQQHRGLLRALRKVTIHVCFGKGCCPISSLD